MIKNPIFDDIRPFYDDEINSAMQRIAESEVFPLISTFVFPGQDIETIREMVRNIKTIFEFQSKVMIPTNKQVIMRSISNFSYSGLENLDKNKQYLFISNHRDIMMDSSLLQYTLLVNGYDTSEITFGSNLMELPLIIDIGKSNKMFRVERAANMAEFYRCSMHLSEYIRFTITQKKQSAWIAQRNGRTKDGIDSTDQGLIKMLGMSHPDNKIDSLSELNIIPVSISYEWEPCDILKTLELYESRHTKYIKKPGEDLNSILTGIVNPKGNVHISICSQITNQELQEFSSFTKNKYNKKVAEMLDKRINLKYKLTANNYIAHDMRYGEEDFRNNYTEAQKELFINQMNKLDKYTDSDLDALKDIFLGIYANPIDEKLKVRSCDLSKKERSYI